MNRISVQPRRKDERGIYAIMANETELGRLKARTHTEAVKLARRKGIGNNLPIWALEIVGESRVTTSKNR